MTIAKFDDEELRVAMMRAVRDIEPRPTLWRDVLVQVRRSNQRHGATAVRKPMFRRRLLAAALVGSLAMVAIGIATGLHMFTSSQVAKPITPTIRPIEGSWARTYQDLASLKAASDVAAAGRITQIIRVTPPSQTSPAFTDYQLTVATVAWDPRHLLASKTILIHQSGGIVGNVRYEVSDDPLFRVGDDVVLFLHQYGPDQYFVVGGPTGRFAVRNGLVYPVNNEGISFTEPPAVRDFLTSLE